MDNRFAERARALIGCRFRAQGRNPALGLDCVGLALRAFGLADDIARFNYRIRGDHRSELVEAIAPYFRRVSKRQTRVGDLLLLRVAGDQLHLAVKTGAGFVHADARLRKVVETPGEPAWPVLGVYRRRSRPKRKD
jgi:hypothetical protein